VKNNREETLAGESPSTDAGPSSSSTKNVLLATVLGTTIEWYDFNIYGIAAALVLGPHFFPKLSDTAGTIAAFATFAIGFIARPFGAALFGHFGDRVGRKQSLVYSILLVGLGTFFIGLLPTYEDVGIWAPVLLVACRIVQSIGVGGEWGGAALMAAEHAPAGRRGFFVGWPQFGSPIGLLLANAVFFGLRAVMSNDQFLGWGWRIPFLLSVVLVAVGLVIRLGLPESPVFERMKRAGEVERVPILTLFRSCRRQVILIAGAHLLNTTVFFLTTVYTLSYMRTIPGLAAHGEIALLAQVSGAVAMAIGIPALCYASDRFGRRAVILPVYLSWIVWIWPMFWLIDLGTVTTTVIAVTIGTFLTSGYGPLGAQYLEQFDTRVRYTGAGFAQYIGSIFGGGFSPLVATQLNAWGGIAAVQGYVVAVAVVASICVYLMRDAAGIELHELDDLDDVSRERDETASPAVVAAVSR
jgi:MFS family permease